MAVSRSQYIKLERGERRLTADYITRAAHVFDVSAGDVIESASTVPLVGYVGAGAAAHYYTHDQGELDRVPAPAGSSSNSVAAEVRGDSLGPFFNGWLIYWNEIRAPVTQDMFGRLCVVGLPNDKILVKRLRQARTPGLFHLESNNPNEPTLFDQEIVWGAIVTDMKQR